MELYYPTENRRKKHCCAITFPHKCVTSTSLCHAFERKTCCSASTFFENLGFRIQRPCPFQNPGLIAWHFHRSIQHSQMSDELQFSDSKDRAATNFSVLPGVGNHPTSRKTPVPHKRSERFLVHIDMLASLTTTIHTLQLSMAEWEPWQKYCAYKSCVAYHLISTQ